MSLQDLWVNLSTWAASLGSSEWIALLLGVYGSILSTVLAVRETRRDRRKIKVTCSPGVLTGGPEGVVKIVSITAINIGHRPVEITSAGFRLNDGMELVGLDHIRSHQDQPLPRVIMDGESVTVSKFIASIANDLDALRRKQGNPGLKITGAFVRDSTGNKYKVAPPRFLKDRDGPLKCDIGGVICG